MKNVAGTDAFQTAHRADRAGVGGEARPGLGEDRGRPPNSLGGSGEQRGQAVGAVRDRAARLCADGEPAVSSAALHNRSLQRTVDPAARALPRATVRVNCR